jgi:hypothetical protein
MARLGRFGLPVLEKLLDGQANILCDEPQQRRRYVSAGMEGDGGGSTVGVAVLLVGATLPNLHETELLEDRDDLAWFQNRG